MWNLTHTHVYLMPGILGSDERGVWVYKMKEGTDFEPAARRVGMEGTSSA